MNIETILKHLGKDMGLNLNLDDEAYLSLKFDDKHMLVIEAPEQADRVFIYSMINFVEPQHKLEIYEYLLEANLFGKGTGNCWFACKPDTGEIFLTCAIDKESLSYDRFSEALEAFLGQLEHWSMKIKEPIFAPFSSQPGAREQPMPELHNPFV